jgi:hypothetical protein
MAKDKKTADLFARREGKKKDSQAEGYFSTGRPSRPSGTGSSRIVTVPLGQILPDPYQPRPILPLEIKEPFFAGEIGWREAAERWLAMTDDPGVAARIETLLELGRTFEDHGQIKPVTGVWESANGQAVFRLETGERRFWARALDAARGEGAAEPHLECREIDGQRRSRERQVVENIHAEPPTAVARAREIAALLLSKLEVPADKDPQQGAEIGEHEYFRSVLDLESLIGKKQMPAGVWDEVGEVMGLSRSLMSRHLQILELPNRLQYEADLHRLSEKLLRHVLKLPEGERAEAIRKAAREDLTAAEMKDYVERRTGKKKRGSPVKRPIQSPTERAASRIRLFFKSAQDDTVRAQLGEVATEFAAGLPDEQIREAADLLEDLAAKLRLRAEE